MGGRFWSLLRERRGAGWASPKAENCGCEQAGDFLKPLLVGHVIRIACRWHGAPPVSGSARNDIRFTTDRFAAESICGTLVLVTYARGSRVVRNGPPFRNVLLTWRGLLTRESESFGPFGTGTVPKSHISVRHPVSRFRTRERGKVGIHQGSPQQTLCLGC